MAPSLTIGQVAKTSGVAAKTIRYYEQIGVLPAPRRAASGYRLYRRIRTNRSTTWSPDGVLAKHRHRTRSSETVLSLINQLLGAAPA